MLGRRIRSNLILGMTMSTFSIVADSGSTKTDWAIIDADSNIVEKVRTKGFNPYFHSVDFIQNEVSKVFKGVGVESHNIGVVHYYGAGCSSDEKKGIVEIALGSQFGNATINVHHDLVGAARASLGHNNGIACIIGTGSNSCVWENGHVSDNIPSHGYVFGDEGSGAHLGIELVKLYLQNNLNDTIRTAFEERYGLTSNEILNATYKKKDPNVFLAQFAAFYEDHLEVEQLRNVVVQCFRAFFRTRILPYNCEYKNLGFVGSISSHYEQILVEVAKEHGYEVANISKCPIDKLVTYHAEAFNLTG